MALRSTSTTGSPSGGGSDSGTLGHQRVPPVLGPKVAAKNICRMDESVDLLHKVAVYNCLDILWKITTFFASPCFSSQKSEEKHVPNPTHMGKIERLEGAENRNPTPLFVARASRGAGPKMKQHVQINPHRLGCKSVNTRYKPGHRPTYSVLQWNCDMKNWGFEFSNKSWKSMLWTESSQVRSQGFQGSTTAPNPPGPLHWGGGWSHRPEFLWSRVAPTPACRPPEEWPGRRLTHSQAELVVMDPKLYILCHVLKQYVESKRGWITKKSQVAIHIDHIVHRYNNPKANFT